MTVVINWPIGFEEEKAYISEVMFKFFLGLDYRLIFTNTTVVEIISSGKKIILPDIFFSKNANSWLKIDSFLSRADQLWSPKSEPIKKAIVGDSIPLLFSNKPFEDDYLKDAEGNILFFADIFGSSFFLLTRYEEYLPSELDQFGRFKITSSIQFREQAIHRPLVNEYLEILWILIVKINPDLTRKKRHFQVMPTHDVDYPFLYLYKTPLGLMREIYHAIRYKKKIAAIFEVLSSYVAAKITKGRIDPFNTFDYIIKTSEERGLRSEFFFICDHTDPKDGEYQINDIHIKKIILKVLGRGHKAGVHGSFFSSNSFAQIQKELGNFIATIRALQNESAKVGNRQHYLKISVTETLKYLNDAGFYSDSSLGFAESPGFRCGVCYSYPLFDLINKKKLDIIESPLIAMECSVIDDRYLGLGITEKSLKVFLDLKNIVRKYEGDFVILWHNNRLNCVEERALYEKVLDG